MLTDAATHTGGQFEGGYTLQDVLSKLGAGVDTRLDLTNPNLSDQVYRAINGPEGSGLVAGLATPKLMAALAKYGQTPQAIADAASDIQQDIQEGPDAFGPAPYTTVPTYGTPPGPNYNTTGIRPPADIPNTPAVQPSPPADIPYNNAMAAAPASYDLGAIYGPSLPAPSFSYSDLPYSFYTEPLDTTGQGYGNYDFNPGYGPYNAMPPEGGYQPSAVLSALSNPQNIVQGYGAYDASPGLGPYGNTPPPAPGYDFGSGYGGGFQEAPPPPPQGQAGYAFPSGSLGGPSPAIDWTNLPDLNFVQEDAPPGDQGVPYTPPDLPAAGLDVAPPLVGFDTPAPDYTSTMWANSLFPAEDFEQPSVDTGALIGKQALQPGQYIDYSSLLSQINDPQIQKWLMWMAGGEVGSGAKDITKEAFIQTALNRALERDQSLSWVLQQVAGGRMDMGQPLSSPQGYYAVTPPTYGASVRPTQTQMDYFQNTLLPAILSGQNYAAVPAPDGGYTIATGNASSDVATHQYKKGTPGARIPGGIEDIFLEPGAHGLYGLPIYTPSWYSSPMPLINGP